jgi:hypothetical protein
VYNSPCWDADISAAFCCNQGLIKPNIAPWLEDVTQRRDNVIVPVWFNHTVLEYDIADRGGRNNIRQIAASKISDDARIHTSVEIDRELPGVCVIPKLTVPIIVSERFLKRWHKRIVSERERPIAAADDQIFLAGI